MRNLLTGLSENETITFTFVVLRLNTNADHERRLSEASDARMTAQRFLLLLAVDYVTTRTAWIATCSRLVEKAFSGAPACCPEAWSSHPRLVGEPPRVDANERPLPALGHVEDPWTAGRAARHTAVFQPEVVIPRHAADG